MPDLLRELGFESEVDAPGMLSASLSEARWDAAGPRALRRGEGTAGEATVNEMQGENGTVVADVMSQINFSVMVYFVSFVFIGSIIAMNVVVAVMLEGFVSSLHEDEKNKRLEIEARNHQAEILNMSSFSYVI